ncbi:hypothetical protein FRB99_008225 [Tulasnella sp. 403]|nr:hypothetical protein FRB99_008225 [Tulasnella sp. 403]
MSLTLAEIVNSNTACCTIPPVFHEYEGKGKYISYAGTDKLYAVGPQDADKVIVVIYDIFGFFPQTIQGADILADVLQARVLMPDLLKGSPFPKEKDPPITVEWATDLEAFFASTGSPAAALAQVCRIGETLKEDGVNKVGVLGFCWGGKLAIECGAKEWVDAVAAVHPALMMADDVNDLRVPLGLFPSRSELVEEYKKMVRAMATKPFASKNAWKLYQSVDHGFASARGDLNDPDGKAQYEDVYARVAGFFETAFEG